MEVRQTDVYAKWFARLRDRQTKARINIRIRRLSLGHLGDAKIIGGGVSELRMDFGPGYRLYFTRVGAEIILLLVGGDKSSQSSDIETAQRLAAALGAKK